MSISQKAREILNRPDLIERRDMWFSRLENLFDGKPDPWNDRRAFAVCGILGASGHDPYTEPERWVEGCLENLAARYQTLEEENYFRPLAVEYGIFGVHYTDKILGANIHFTAGQWYCDHLTTPVGSLKRPDLDKDPVWNATRRAIDAFLEADVKLPLFGLPTIASVLNVVVNLYSQDILMAMLLEPENAAADLRTINNLLCEMHEYCRCTIPEQQLQPVISHMRTQPPGYGQLCGCTTQLLSADMYADLIAPLDDQLLSVYPHGGMIHLCGAHTHHIPAFREMKSLRAIQINDRAASDLQEYFDGLREDQIIYLNPCEGMTIEKAMEITNGHRLVISDTISAPVLRK